MLEGGRESKDMNTKNIDTILQNLFENISRTNASAHSSSILSMV